MEEYRRIANRLLVRGELRRQWVACLLGRMPTPKQWSNLRFKLNKEGRLIGPHVANTKAPPIARRIFNMSHKALAEDAGYVRSRAQARRHKEKTKAALAQTNLTEAPPTARELRRKRKVATPTDNPNP